ncbi:MAG TPA: PAS domain S-box protein [Stellaceae bacterium]|nr:PAS domain S-box protein [Stellaceae bacterium]
MSAQPWFGTIATGLGDRTPGAEADVQTVHAINQRIFETSLDLILVVDKRGTFVRVSPSAAAILGYGPAEMVGRSAREFLHPDDLDNTRNEMRLARRGRETRNFECRYIHRDGHDVPLSWTGVWSEPEQQHFFIGRDMTELKAAEQRLRQAQKIEAIGQLTGGIAHDFNNVLAVIIGNLELLEPDIGAIHEGRAILGDALEAAKLGADLTRRLLAFARQQQLQPRRVQLNGIVSGAASLLRRTLGPQIEISAALADDLWPVTVDPVQLESSLINLATNARDAMPRGGQLSFATANRHLDADYAAMHAELAPGDYAMIEISDTGMGMTPDVAARIFEPFFTTKEAGKGTGLGLSTVFGFLKQSAGHVNVYSEVGRGTTFRLYLPRAASGDASEKPAPPSRAVGGSETILVVDDNAAMRRVVRAQLGELGYRVLEADAPAAALDLLAHEAVDLLFSDIAMPGGVSGIELAQRALAAWPRLKVVLSSGFAPARRERDAAGLVHVPLLNKPYDREEIARVLRQALDGAEPNRRGSAPPG